MPTDTPNTNKVFIGAIPYVQNGNGDYLIPVANSDGTPVGGAVQSEGADGENNTVISQRVASRVQGFNGNTWDRLRAGITGIVSSVLGFLNILDFGQYNVTEPNLTNGQFAVRQINSKGHTKVINAGLEFGADPTKNVQGVVQKPIVSGVYTGVPFTNYGSATKANVRNSEIQLKSIAAQNENAAIRYLQIFNLAAAPVDDTSVPLLSFAIPAGTANNPGLIELGANFFGEHGLYLSTGLSWGISVDPDVFDETGVTAGEHQINGIAI